MINLNCKKTPDRIPDSLIIGQYSLKTVQTDLKIILSLFLPLLPDEIFHIIQSGRLQQALPVEPGIERGEQFLRIQYQTI